MIKKNTKTKDHAALRLVNLTGLDAAALLAWAQALLPDHKLSAGRAVSQGPNLVIYDDIATALARAARSGGAGLTATLSEWKKTAAKALKTGASDPANSFLLSTGAAAELPQETAQALAGWLGATPAQAAFVHQPDITALDSLVLISALRLEPDLGKTSTGLAARGFARALPKDLSKPDVARAHDIFGQLLGKTESQAETLTRQVQWIESLRKNLWEEAGRAAQAEAQLITAENNLHQFNEQLRQAVAEKNRVVAEKAKVVAEKDKHAAATAATKSALAELQQKMSKTLKAHQSEQEQGKLRYEAERAQARILSQRIEQERKEASDREHALKVELLYLQTRWQRSAAQPRGRSPGLCAPCADPFSEAPETRQQAGDLGRGAGSDHDPGANRFSSTSPYSRLTGRQARGRKSPGGVSRRRISASGC